MRNKILAQVKEGEKSGIKLDEESKTLDDEEIEDEVEPEAEDNEDKTDTVTNIEQYDNSQSYFNTSRTK